VPLWSFTVTGGPGHSGLAFDAAASLVARAVGAADRPQEVGAHDAIRMAVDKLNEYNWNYLLVRGSNVSIVAGTAAYALPTNFKSPYDLRTTSSGRSLQYVERKNWSLVRRDQNVAGTPELYTLFSVGQLGELELLPAPSMADVLELRYYRPITKPSDPTSLLDVTSQMERALVLLAQELVVLWSSPGGRKVEWYATRAEDSLRGALLVDRENADDDVGLMPQTSYGSPRWPESHPYHWLDT